MLRWLMRLVVVGLIGLGLAYAVSRLMGQDEDFDDFDDIEAGFEFEETPVEIDVPANTLQTGGGSAELAVGGENMTEADADGGDSGDKADSNGGGEAGKSSGSLIDINGIGPSYAARLEAAGIATIGDLANASAEDIASKMDVIGGSSAIEDWIAQAKGMRG